MFGTKRVGKRALRILGCVGLVLTASRATAEPRLTLNTPRIQGWRFNKTVHPSGKTTFEASGSSYRFHARSGGFSLTGPNATVQWSFVDGSPGAAPEGETSTGDHCT